MIGDCVPLALPLGILHQHTVLVQGLPKYAERDKRERIAANATTAASRSAERTEIGDC